MPAYLARAFALGTSIVYAGPPCLGGTLRDASPVSNNDLGYGREVSMGGTRATQIRSLLDSRHIPFPFRMQILQAPCCYYEVFYIEFFVFLRVPRPTLAAKLCSFQGFCC